MLRQGSVVELWRNSRLVLQFRRHTTQRGKEDPRISSGDWERHSWGPGVRWGSVDEVAGGGVAMVDGTDRGAELRPGCARLVAANRGEGLGRSDQRQFQLALQASWRGQWRRRLAAVARGVWAACVVVHGARRVGLPSWARSKGPWACEDFTTDGACAARGRHGRRHALEHGSASAPAPAGPQFQLQLFDSVKLKFFEYKLNFPQKQKL
jgi:hypothetical protein